MAGIRYGKIKKELTKTLAPADPTKYAVTPIEPEERAFFWFKTVIGAAAVFIIMLMLPLSIGSNKKKWGINEARLKKYEKLLPDKRLVMACIQHLKGEKK